MNKRLLPLLFLVALPAFGDFRDVERDLRSQLGRPTYIPMMGLVRFATWIVHPHGVHDFQLTVWEKKEDIAIDGVTIEQKLKRGLAPDFQPVVRVRSRGEWTFIYGRPLGDRIELTLVTHDHDDTVLIRADVDAEELSQTIRDRRLVARR